MKKELIKLTFTGDIMSSALQNQACRKEDGTYDYSQVFSPIVGFLRESDYLCGNLETPIGGSQGHFTDEAAVFNTPESFLSALKQCGFHYLSTANNHAMDRGEQGLIDTLFFLDKYQFDHSGTYRTEMESRNLLVKEFQGMKVAFISFTYGVNSEFHGLLLPEEKTYMIDLLKQQSQELRYKPLPPSGLQKIKKQVVRNIPVSCKEFLRTFLPKRKAQGELDNVLPVEIHNPDNERYMERVRLKIRKACTHADFVVCNLHCGGQYNNEIGAYTQFIHRELKKEGVDLIVGNHPHCILPYQLYETGLSTYSLGNFTFTPYDGWYIDGVLADYSVLLHAYLNPIEKTIEKYTFSIVKNVRTSELLTQTFLLYDLIRKEDNTVKKASLLIDNREAIKRFTGKEIETIQREYVLN